jgi:hypothetical protein
LDVVVGSSADAMGAPMMPTEPAAATVAAAANALVIFT